MNFAYWFHNSKTLLFKYVQMALVQSPILKYKLPVCGQWHAELPRLINMTRTDVPVQGARFEQLLVHDNGVVTNVSGRVGGDRHLAQTASKQVTDTNL